jgi:hypothetical protein
MQIILDEWSLCIYMLLDVWTLLYIYIYICYELLICSLQLWLTECIIYFELETECRFLFSSDGWADVSLSVATVAPSSDGWMMSVCPSLLGATIATDVFWLSLLCHYNNALVATGRLPMATVTYGLLIQCLFIIVVFVIFINKFHYLAN